MDGFTRAARAYPPERAYLLQARFSCSNLDEDRILLFESSGTRPGPIRLHMARVPDTHACEGGDEGPETE